MTGGQLRLGLPFTEEFSVTLRYSLYQQDAHIPNDEKQPYNDCSIPIPGYHALNADGTPNRPVLRRQRRGFAGDQGIARARR